MADDVLRVLRASSLGEVGWVESGTPRAAGVLPLVDGEGPVLALTFDRVGLATSIAGAQEAVLLVREPRNTGPGWHALALRCRTRLVPDPEGDHLVEHLLLEELRRYPPSRRYADSPLLMREHWWYLPRLLVRLDVVEVLPPPPDRRGPHDLSLTTGTDARPAVSGVSVERGSLRTSWGPRPTAGPGVLLAQDATFPDLEAWSWAVQSVVVGSDGTLSGDTPATPHPRPPSLVERWRAERTLARSCRRGVHAWTSRA